MRISVIPVATYTRVAAPKANIASAFQRRDQLLQKRDIESGFDKNAPPVGKLHAQTAACPRCTDQVNRQQPCSSCCHSASAFPIAIIIQRVDRYTTRFAIHLPAQSTLLKVPHQALRLRLAPTTNRDNCSRISHASTSTCNQIGEKSGFPRRDTSRHHDSSKYKS